MTSLCRMTRPLKEEEKQAGKEYVSDSTFYHAVAQGRTELFNLADEFNKYSCNCKKHHDALDRAIEKCELISDVELYSGHGNGFSVRGSLIGNSKKFIGLEYSYTGYISTSSSLDWVKNFLKPRFYQNSRPVILKFKLLAGFHALDMREVGHCGEFEYLLGRNLTFNITNGEMIIVDGIQDKVLFLELSQQ